MYLKMDKINFLTNWDEYEQKKLYVNGKRIGAKGQRFTIARRASYQIARLISEFGVV